MPYTPRTRLATLACLPVLVAALSACDIVTADFKVQEQTEWRKTYPLPDGGRVEVVNVNGGITVEPASGNTVEIVAVKVAHAGTKEAAKELLEHIEIADDSSTGAIHVETRVPKTGGLFSRGGAEVRYTVRVPASADTRVVTVNGGLEVAGVSGRLRAESTNGAIRAREIAGPIEATTTNGSVEVELTRIASAGVRIETTNGRINLRLPRDARASISASVSNGGIDTNGLSLETSESSRRKLEARLNGGGPSVRLEGVNGGIDIAGR